MYRYNSDTERLLFRHRGERVFMFDGTADTGFISTGAKFCEDCPWGKSDFSKLQVLPCIACSCVIASVSVPTIATHQIPNTAKLLRLSFHDCVPYIGQDGEVHGGGAVEYCTRYLHFISTLSVLLLEYMY